MWPGIAGPCRHQETQPFLPHQRASVGPDKAPTVAGGGAYIWEYEDIHLYLKSVSSFSFYHNCLKQHH